MILLLGVVVIAVAVGYAIGGRLGNLGSIRLQWWWLAPLGLALQLIPVSADRSNPFGYALLVASYVVLVVFAARNLRLAGMVPVLVGLALNGLVVTANHGMPVTRSALRESGQESLLNDLEKHGGAKHHLSRDDDELVFLADSIPIPKPIGQVVSVGDVLIYAGVIWAVAAAMRRRTRETATAPRSARSSSSNPPDPPPDPPSPPPSRNSGTPP